MKILLTAILILLQSAAFAQDVRSDAPFDSWTVFTSHRDVVQIEPMGANKLAARTTGGFFLFDLSDGVATVYNTGDGKYRSSATTMVADPTNNMVWFGYADGTISMFNLQTSRFRHFNDISRNDRFLSNRVNAMHLFGNTLYIGTDFGLVLFDVTTRVVIDSYTRFANFPSETAVLNVDVYSNMIYLATNAGVAAADRSISDLKLVESWEAFPTAVHFGGEPVQRIQATLDAVIAATPVGNFRLEAGLWSEFQLPGSQPIANIMSVSDAQWIIATSNRVVRLDPRDMQSEQLLSVPSGSRFNSAVLTSGETIFAGTNNRGMVRSVNNQQDLDFFEPNGPSHNLFEEFAVADNGDVVGTASPTPGRFNIGFNDTGFYIFRNGIWENFNILTNSELQSTGINSLYTTAVVGDQYFFGTWGRGLVRYDRSTGEIARYNTANSDLPGFNQSSSFVVISGVAADKLNPDHVWVISRGTANRPLGKYSILNDDITTFARLPQLPVDSRYTKVYTDSHGQLWVTLENNAEEGRGIMVIRDPEGGTDSAFRLTSAEDAGALPNEKVNAIVQDRRGEVWVGTDRGMGRFLFPDRIITGNAMERRAQPLINADTSAFDRILLRNARVTALAVDGNNQKWVGTDGDGVYLIEESGRGIIRNFTTSNSPLTSNVIKSLALNSRDGELYIATENGFVVYRTLEQEARESMQTLRIFPNPYSYQRDGGTPIVLEDLVDNTTVSIMTVDGRLVRRFVTRGGRAQWDGLDAEGNRVATGVYFIVANENNGNQIARGRLVIVR